MPGPTAQRPLLLVSGPLRPVFSVAWGLRFVCVMPDGLVVLFVLAWEQLVSQTYLCHTNCFYLFIF